jgi:hypothetical protein
MLGTLSGPEETGLSAEEDIADVKRVRAGDLEAFSGIVRR